MAAPRGEFTSRFGFLMAASGSAVGLGNIWGFPTNAASNGGAAFLFTYLILAFALAYPALMAELIIGRYARANAVTALRTISSGNKTRLAALLVGFIGIVTVSSIGIGIILGTFHCFHQNLHKIIVAVQNCSADRHHSFIVLIYQLLHLTQFYIRSNPILHPTSPNLHPILRKWILKSPDLQIWRPAPLQFTLQSNFTKDASMMHLSCYGIP